MRFPRRRRSSFNALRRTDPRLAACIVLAVAAIAVISAYCGGSDGTTGIGSSPTARSQSTPADATSPDAATPTAAAANCALPASLPPVFCADVSRMEHGDVTRIIDGDTFDVLLDGREERVRFFGIDTPERGDACFSEATEATRQLTIAGVRLLADDRNSDRNGRLLRYVYTPDGVSVDAALIANGYTRAWTDDGQHRDALVTLEGVARDGHIGCLWRRQ